MRTLRFASAIYLNEFQMHPQPGETGMRRTLPGLLFVALTMGTALYAFAPRHTPPLEPTRIAVDSMRILALEPAGDAMVAGGELGYVLRSTDGGNSWQVAKVEPQRDAPITRIRFSDPDNGMAVGHEGLILRTSDGGQTWQELHFDEQDGTPLMDIRRLPSGTWVAVGAFARVLRSVDDGKTWESVKIPGTEAEEPHLNSLVPGFDSQDWLLVGERGLVMRSSDGGETFEPVPQFYTGSFYGAVPLDPQNWVVYGMRGHVYRSVDGGATWTASELQAPVSSFGHAFLSDRTLLLVGQGGVVQASRDSGATFKVVKAGGLASFTSLVPLDDGRWLIASDQGIRSHDQAAAARAAQAGAQR
jgi:photosystem II stability/assembly factor-like uncharacterized protein